MSEQDMTQSELREEQLDEVSGGKVAFEDIHFSIKKSVDLPVGPRQMEEEPTGPE